MVVVPVKLLDCLNCPILILQQQAISPAQLRVVAKVNLCAIKHRQNKEINHVN